MAGKLIDTSKNLQSQSASDARNKAVILVKEIVDRTLEEEDQKRTLLFAGQVISDFEEFWDQPFGSVHSVNPGCGASWFLGAYRRGLPLSEKKPEVTTDTMICERIVRVLHERSTLELDCLGFYKDTNDGSVRSKLNKRLITENDGEHMCCKGMIRITQTFPAYRISRRISPAQPYFHPVWYDPGWPNEVEEIAKEAIDAYKKLVGEERWPVLHDIFKTNVEMRTSDVNHCNNKDEQSISMTGNSATLCGGGNVSLESPEELPNKLGESLCGGDDHSEDCDLDCCPPGGNDICQRDDPNKDMVLQRDDPNKLHKRRRLMR